MPDWRPAAGPGARKVSVTLQRRMEASDKIAAVFALSRLVISLAEADVRRQHPEASEREIFLRAAAHRLGEETVAKVYGWRAPEAGS